MDHPEKNILICLVLNQWMNVVCFKIRETLQRIVGCPAMFPVETMWFSEPLMLETHADTLRMYQEAGNFVNPRVKTDLYMTYTIVCWGCFDHLVNSWEMPVLPNLLIFYVCHRCIRAVTKTLVIHSMYSRGSCYLVNLVVLGLYSLTIIHLLASCHLTSKSKIFDIPPKKTSETTWCSSILGSFDPFGGTGCLMCIWVPSPIASSCVW